MYRTAAKASQQEYARLFKFIGDSQRSFLFDDLMYNFEFLFRRDWLYHNRSVPRLREAPIQCFF